MYALHYFYKLEASDNLHHYYVAFAVGVMLAITSMDHITYIVLYYIALIQSSLHPFRVSTSSLTNHDELELLFILNSNKDSHSTCSSCNIILAFH